MIISRPLKYVYIATPKTGTRTMYKWLKKHYQGKQVGDHLTEIPAGCEGYFVFTTVRSPYPRIVSSWWSTVMQEEDRYARRQSLDAWKGKHDLETFLLWLLAGRPFPKGTSCRALDHFWSGSNQTDFLANVAHIDRIIKLEELPVELPKLPFVTSPHPETLICNASKDRKHWMEYMTPRIVHLVGEWAAPDFAAYGYSFLRGCRFKREGGLK